MLEERAMTSLQPLGPNAEQIQYWNELAAPRWVALQGLIDAQIGPLGRRAMQRGAIGAGEHVLDVGCGCGHTTLEIARRVGPMGSVTGVDIATAMLERARQAVREAGLTQVHFENVDAQLHAFEPGGFDVVFSRFGVMFFADPAAAFANLRAALRPGGRLTFVCWQALQRNPWMFVPFSAALQHVPPPPRPAPGAPGPFAFADSERVRTILACAGFADVAVEAATEMLTIGDGSLDKAVYFLTETGPTARLLREVSADVRSVVTGAVREALAAFLTPQGVCLGAAAWIVSGRRA
jgi:SAM-dependent methyltransferase